MKKIITSFLGVAALISNAQAGSFQINLQGMKQTAMGGAGTANPWDVSTLFYNPAGLSFLNSMQVNGGVFFVNPNVRYIENEAGGYINDADKKTSTPFAFYVGGRLSQDDRVGFGLGVYTPFGSSVSWGDDWRGRFITQSISLQSIFFQPTVSYRITDRLSLGVGFVYGTGGVKIKKALPVADANGEGQASLEGKANGMGVNAGIQYEINDDWRIGLSYRSGVNMRVKSGTAKFRVPASLVGNFPDTDFSTELNLPDIVTLGISGKIAPFFTLSGDLVFAKWSNYQSLAFDFKNNTPTLADTDDPRKYENTFAVRIGAHYEPTATLEFMAGASFDPTPTQVHLVSPDAVDGNRYGLNAGVAFKPNSRLELLGTLGYTWIPRRSVSYEPANFSGTYQVKSLTPAIGLTYKFLRNY